MTDLGLLKPLTIFEQTFENKTRVDGRGFKDFKETIIKSNLLSSCYGSAFIKSGDTEVIAGLKVKVIPDLCNAGYIDCNIEFLGHRLSHSQTKLAQCLSSTVQRLLDNYAFPSVKDQLNIYSHLSINKKAPTGSYLLKIDIIILQDDGCLLDACLSAALVCLSSARWPKLVAVGDGKSDVLVNRYKVCEPVEEHFLSISEWIIGFTFCFAPCPVSDLASAPSIFTQPTKREMECWDVDSSPVYLALTPNGRVVDLLFINGMQTNLWNIVHANLKSNESSTNAWVTLFDLATHHAPKIKNIMVEASHI